ncbi:MAG: peptidoglycan DD-metalloendopeptidase family protein [Magnetococcales bacterium]|nr:peptidoglycan DD-metalloendopeptidase family protein [Magnetococcales bacterium]
MNTRFSLCLIPMFILPVLVLGGCVESENMAKVRIETGPPLAWGLEPSPTIKPSKSGVYIVQPGDTLWAIAAVHGVEVEDLAQWNRLQNPDQLWVGQGLVTSKPADEDHPVVSGPLQPPKASVSDIEDVRAKDKDVAKADVGRVDGAKAKEPPQEPSPKPVMAKVESVKQPVADDERVQLPVVPPAMKPKAVANDDEDRPAPAEVKSSWVLPPDAPKTWIWPHSGKVISKFGKTGARQNNGIDIAANEGDAVVASADGIVAYADDSLPGYGNLILLRHGGFFTTAYGHNQKILVKRGQAVKAGEKIALAGKSGGAKQPQLHFELRRHITPLNPLSSLPRRD